MKYGSKALLRWLALACAFTLAGCGGGGGGDGTTATTSTTTTAAPDARNGDYQMYAADARAYTLTLNFDSRTYRVVGNGQDLSGSISSNNTSGVFDFDNPVGTIAAPYAPKFTWFSDTVVGGFAFASGTVPFIASRSFVTTLAEAAGTYNYLATSRDTAAASNNLIFSGEVLASGTLRTCNDSTIYKISLCPGASVATSTVTVAGDLFTAANGSGTFPFRIAKVGTERVFLRASASTTTATARLFWVGIPEAATFADGTFEGANTNGEWAATSFSGAAYDANWIASGGAIVRSGTATAIGPGGNSPGGILAINAGADGNFFAMRNSGLLVLVAARNNPSWPGYVEIGKR